MLHLLGQAVFGLIVGVIAKLLLPGHDPGGVIATALIGVAGSLAGTVVGRLLTRDPSYSAHWLMSIAGTLVLLIAYRLIVG